MERIKCVKKFLKPERDREQYLGFTLGSLVKTISKVLLVSRPLPIFPQRIRFNVQYITAIKCITTHKKIKEIGGAFGKIEIFSHYVSMLPPIPFQNSRDK